MSHSSLEKLPPYLRRYCAEQDYSKYTPRDQAGWRYIMRQSRDFFRDNAVPIYLDGLRKTGIPLDRIPRISEMDAALQEFGWGAVPVCGFIPPIAFLDLQARGILPIATDMRTVEHIAYTPAPDIVHEAAGHAPIIADEKYRAYLKQYARMADKTIMSREDLNVYEAVRILSDIKENPDTKPAEVIAAQRNVDRASAAVSFVSEATRVSRMAWWTVEYGLVGSLKSPKIYGAGLLSSIGESQNCLSPRVRKIPLSVKCTDYTYDITEPQPQLFVAEDMDHLTHVLMDFEGQLSFKIGGVRGLEEARKAQTVNTVRLDNGVEISGVVALYEAAVHGAVGDVHFIKCSGPVQLCYEQRQLAGQGREQHPQGFSMPVGRWAKYASKSSALLTESELNSIGVRVGQRTVVDFVNGFRVDGAVKRIERRGEKILYISWTDCTVTRGSQTYFEPAWGDFDMPIAEQVVSVFGGPADREAYGEYEMGGVSTQPGRTSPFSADEKNIFACYQSIRDVRSGQGNADLGDVAKKAVSEHGNEWLLTLEVLEAGRTGKPVAPEQQSILEGHLKKLATSADDVTRALITNGLKIASTPD